MKIVITGANGFIGKNLYIHLKECGFDDVVMIGRDNTDAELNLALIDADLVYHLAGVNRPQEPSEFAIGNLDSTKTIIKILKEIGRAIPVVYASSIQAELNNPYGLSKRAAEDALLDYSNEYNVPVYLYRLPNVFGKWSRPFYNSAVATFCHQISRDEVVTIHDSSAKLQLVYIDDVCKTFINIINDVTSTGFQEISPVYETNVGELVAQLREFREGRETLIINNVGEGFCRALYSTYISFLSSESFSYAIPSYADARGVFVEMLKTKNSGQFSYFTARPGITRGGHYHHSKTEKFLVIRGEARFRFQHISSSESVEIFSSGTKPTIVETIPGWAHDITNIGNEEMIVMLWANEIFDRNHPDTVSYEI
ncbi:MAG: NAD-dependent epimerase/dehydratase family protein [Candidatus Dependentiae bacterium]|nr:NAD-dependent epimerase/dehydratase family protein [Candidatus Dependentiae bacterium]